MVAMSWRELDAELDRWRDGGQVADFWWRDDDAAKPSAPLARLLDLSQSSRVPLALAVVPLEAVPEIFNGLKASVLMHGTDHRNRAAPGEKKTEFAGDEPDGDAVARLSAARQRLAAQAPQRFLAVLAPPWNRFKQSLVARLPEAGLYGLSGYGPRDKAEAARGVRQVNTHVDIIDWRGTRRFVGEEAALRIAANHLASRREGDVDAKEPTGWLTHHALHDKATWEFLERLFERTSARGARWIDPVELFPSRAR
jgi:peptidoglycan/xylan/chitin deacetylase (PgdA/CDA1 family)